MSKENSNDETQNRRSIGLLRHSSLVVRHLAFLASVLFVAEIPAADSSHPNILFLFPDQWRAQAFGFAGDPNVKTPQLDRFEKQSVHFIHAVAGVPVCCPTRASLFTGQRPLTTGVFLNDVPLSTNAVSLAKVLQGAGYDTAYIGKWHLNGDGRSRFISPERRQGFQYWKAQECTHDYNHSSYYAGTPDKVVWPGYDAFAQTQDAAQYIRAHASSAKPFFLFLAWGPPHDPYDTAPPSSALSTLRKT